MASKTRIDVVGEITQRTLAGIRREGKNRGRGQVEGLIRQDVERIASFAENEQDESESHRPFKPASLMK